MSKTIGAIVKAKGRIIWSVHPEDSVRKALEIMARCDIGAVLVMDGHDMVGILTERDYARKVILRGKASITTPVYDIMTRDVICVGPETTVEEGLAIMTTRQIRHLPVVDDSGILGVVSIKGLARAVISDQEQMIGHLEEYIVGRTSPEAMAV